MSALSCIRALGKLSAAGLALSLASCTATNFSEPVSASTSFDGPFSIEADRIIVMDQGRVVMQGTPKEVFSHVEELKGYQAQGNLDPYGYGTDENGNYHD